MQMPGWKGHFDLSKTKQEFWKLDEHSGVSELFLYVAVMAFLGALLLSNKEETPPPTCFIAYGKSCSKKALSNSVKQDNIIISQRISAKLIK